MPVSPRTSRPRSRSLLRSRQCASTRSIAAGKIVQEFTDAGASARTADRPALRQLLARCSDDGPTKTDVVFVHKLDRLARNLADHVAIRAQLRSRRVTLASVTEGLEDSVSGQLVEHILASMAEFYSANLSEEVKKGMRQKILQGGWPHRLPRGYRITRSVHRSMVEIDAVQGPLVRRAFEICANDYQGLVDLRWRLAAAGLRTRAGRPVSNGYLGRLLRNPFYCGRMSWNGDLYPGAHPLLVEPKLFEAVQNILAARSKPLRRNQGDLPLCGLAVCATCGTPVGVDRHRRWTYYRCRRSFRAFERCKAKYCNAQRVDQSLEPLLRQIRIRRSVVTEVVRLAAFEDQTSAQWRSSFLLALRFRQP